MPWMRLWAVRVVLEEWIVGDGQLPEPLVGGVIARRMLIMSCDRLTAVAAGSAVVNESPPFTGVVTWRGSSVNGDVVVLDCGFPMRVESRVNVQKGRPAKGQRATRVPGLREWLVPVVLDVPAVGSSCSAWGEIRIAAAHEMGDGMLEDGFPDIRRTWRVVRVESGEAGRYWILELEAVGR